MCHLWPLVKRLAEKDVKTAKAMVERIAPVVDKFHFKNHVGEYCRANYDPAKVHADGSFKKTEGHATAGLESR